MNRTNYGGIRKCYEISTLHAERLAVGTDGKAYITLDLYFTFHKLLLKTRVSLMDLYATLQSLKGPYLHILVQDMDTIKMPPKSIHEGTNICLYTVDCHKCKTRSSFFSWISKAMDFPGYFGRNWDALNDCLGDIDWLSKYEGWALLFLNAEQLLCKEKPDEFKTLVEILDGNGKEWSVSRCYDRIQIVDPKPFHFIFHIDPANEDSFMNRLSQATEKLSGSNFWDRIP